VTAPVAVARNPSWSAAEILAEVRARPDIPTRWAPRHLELGCGKHGCVYETGDPDVVLKITDDDTEGEVAAHLGEIVEPVCVRYLLVLESGIVHGNRRILLLWRERATMVGEILQVIEEAGERLPPRGAGRHPLPPPRERAESFVDLLLEAGQTAFWAASQAHATALQVAADDYLRACRKMAAQKTSPELAMLGAGMADVYARHGVIFGDVHAGNLGLVQRIDGPRWVITDPGHVVMIQS